MKFSYFKLKLLIIVASLEIIQSINIIEPFDFLKEFKVYWNIPTFQCRSHKIHFEDLGKKYNIQQNKNDDFKGDKVTILYDPGNFPAILTDDRTNELFFRNGGVPQEGNISDHLDHYKQRIKDDIPNKNYDGIVVIDFESWRPVYRQNWAALQPYKNLSINIERKRHPFWKNADIIKEASKRFEKAGRKFMEETLLFSKKLRPNATWGYYAYPYCFNYQNLQECSSEVQDENNKINWLFSNSDNFHPSLYMPKLKVNEEERISMIEGRIMESKRINLKLRNSKLILPYFWYNYMDTGTFLSKEDVQNSFIALKSLNIDGVILWGSSNDVNSKKKCELLYKYMDQILGPAIVGS